VNGTSTDWKELSEIVILEATIGSRHNRGNEGKKNKKKRRSGI